MELHYVGQSLVQKQYPAPFLANSPHLLQGLVRVKHVLQAKSVNYTVVAVVIKWHVHCVSKGVIVIEKRTGLGRAHTHHVGTVVEQGQVDARLIEAQVAVGSSTGL